MKKSLLLTLPLGLALLASPASARFFTYHGSTCQPATATDASCLSSDVFGVRNNCSTARVVECPVNADLIGNPTVTYVSYNAYDRHTTQGVSCVVQKLNSSGGVLYNAAVSTTGTAAGVQTVTVFPGVTQSSWWRLQCTIPAVQGGQFSHLANYSMLTNE